MAIVLQESLRGLFYAPFYVALAHDAYAKEGVEVRFVSAPEPGRAGIAIMSGEADVNWGGPMRVMQTYHNDPACDLVSFAEVVTRDPFLLVGREARPGFSVGDLEGARLASVSEVPTPWMCLQEDLRRAGVAPETISRVPDRTMAENCAALLAGTVDAVQVFEPFVSTLLANHGCHIWYAQASRGPTSYTTFYARRGTLTARRDELTRMTRAIYKTQRWTTDASGAAIAEAVRPFFPDVPPSILEAACARYKSLGIWGRDPILPRAGYDRLLESLVSGGFVHPGTPFSVAVDNSLAEEAVSGSGG
ncbi:MAG: ABC transporter substrate-binding protein [Acetobacteraceae bacterium]|nr:ABC transporter substrate-binding protein [Acetobacteraceae bacterium]